MEPRPGHLAVAVGRADGDVIAACGIVALAGGPWHSSHGGRIDARLRFLPPHDPQFRRNRERVVRDAERENLLLDWDLGIPEEEAIVTAT